MLLVILKVKKLLGRFTKKNSKNQKEFMIELTIKRKFEYMSNGWIYMFNV